MMLSIFAMAVFAFLLLAKTEHTPQETLTHSEETLNSIKFNIISAIPTTLNSEPEKVLLGQKLFFDKGLSADQSVACASCHQLNLGGL
jgi:cytochrome c peroxidase